LNRYNSTLIQFSSKMKKATIVGMTLCFFVAVFSIPLAYAQSTIPITKSDYMDKVEFDGRWTFLSEWKPSSHTDLVDPGHMVIRTAHQDNYIYVMLDICYGCWR